MPSAFIQFQSPSPSGQRRHGQYRIDALLCGLCDLCVPQVCGIPPAR